MPILPQQRPLGPDLQSLLYFILIIFLIRNDLFAGPPLRASGTLILTHNRHMDNIAIPVYLDAKLIFNSSFFPLWIEDYVDLCSFPWCDVSSL